MEEEIMIIEEEETITPEEETFDYNKLRYILDKNDYICHASIGALVICDLGECTKYTGEIPNGYSSINEWYDKEIDRLNAWKIIDGNLVYDENKYNELKKKAEIEEEENKCATHKWVNDKFNLINEVYDDELSTIKDGSSLFSIENTKNTEIVSMKITPNEIIKEDLTISVSSENMLENKALNQTIRGIEFEVNEDKSITLNGTCECGKNLFNINTVVSVAQGELSNGILTTNILNNTSVTNAGFTYDELILEAGTYYLSCDIRLISGTASFNKMNDWVADWTKITAPTLSNEYQKYVYTKTYTSTTSIKKLLFQFSKSTNAQIEIKDIMISKDKDTIYEPYQEYMEYDLLNNVIDNNIKPILPVEYQQVEYIESDGKEYIDTGINADTNLRTILDMTFLVPTTPNQNIGAIKIGTTNARYHLLCGDVTINFWVNDTSYKLGNLDTERHYYDLNVPNGKVVFDEQVIDIPTNISDTGLNFWLFARNSTSSKYYSKIKLYSCKMYYENDLVRDFIPCYRKSDKEAGLYDLVNNTFYTSQGSGKFAYGKNIYDYKKYLFFVNNEDYKISGFPANVNINLYNSNGADKELIYSGNNDVLNFDETKYITSATLQIPTGTSFKNIKVYPMITLGNEEKDYVMSQGSDVLRIDLDNYNFKGHDYIDLERNTQTTHIYNGLFPSSKLIVGSGIYPSKETEIILNETIEPLTTFNDKTFIQCDKNVKFSIKYFPKDYINEQLAKIQVEKDKILIEVEKKVDEELTSAKIIAKINDDKSEVKIEADKVDIKANDVLDILSGNEINLTSKNININSTNFKVDKNGNATMASATLTNGTLKLGTKEIFNTSGVLSMFQYQCSGGEQNIGWFEEYDMYSGNAYYKKKGLQILYNIPSNFTVINAYVVFTHIPCQNEINVDGNISYYNGYARNVKLYSLDNMSGLKYFRYGWNGLPDYSSLDKTEITNSSGTNVLNFTGSANNTTSKTTIDISSSLIKGSSQMLLIDTADTSVSGMADSLQKTAMGTATLFVIGYYKLS